MKNNPITQKEYRRRHSQQYKETHRRWYWAHHAEARACEQERRQRVRVEVLTYYGNGKLACVYCGFSDVRALSIDHINGGGKAHLKLLRKANIAEWLYTQRPDYPKGYQTLCMNCQWIKRRERGENGSVNDASPVSNPASSILPSTSQ